MGDECNEFSGMNEAESEMVYDEIIAAMRRKDPTTTMLRKLRLNSG